jgi:hypothetical protein
LNQQKQHRKTLLRLATFYIKPSPPNSFAPFPQFVASNSNQHLNVEYHPSIAMFEIEVLLSISSEAMTGVVDTDETHSRLMNGTVFERLISLSAWLA